MTGNRNGRPPEREAPPQDGAELYRSILNASPDVIVITDLEGRIRTVSPSAGPKLGYASADDLVGRLLSDLLVPADRERGKAALAHRSAGAISGSGEYRAIRADGEVIDVEANGDLVRDATGRPTGMVFIARDVTARKRAEVALRDSEEKHRAIFENATEGIYQTTPEGRYIRVNPAFARMFGYASPEAMIAAVSEIGRQLYVHPEDRDRLKAALAEAGRVAGFEAEMRRADGGEFWISINAHVVRDADGRVAYFEGTNADITERKRAEAALKESEDKFRHLFEHSVVGKSVTLLDGQVTVNRAFEEMLGYGPGELDRARWQALTHPDDVALTEREIAGLMSGEKRSARFEKRFFRKDGSIACLDLSSSLRRGASGEPLYLMTSFIDITERKRAEAALAQSEARSKAVLRAIPDMMFLFDRDGVFLDFNAPDADALFTPPSTFLGRRASEILPREIAELTMVHIDEIVRSGSTSPYFYEAPRGDEIRLYESRMVACTDATFLAIVRDVTERRRAEDEKARLEAQLRQAQKMESIGRLAGGVAHDFNNMLGVIIGHAELALDSVRPGHPLEDYLSEIRSAASRSADLTKQLLAFARKQTAAPVVLDLNGVVAGTLKMLERLIGERVRLGWRPAAGLWSIRMDPSQVEQILTNLCVNARDAIADVGAIEIEVSNCAVDAAACAGHADAAPGEYVRLVVRDDGCGMDEETLAHAFEPFFTTKAIGEGTGLGLATVYGIVRQNGGFVGVESAPGRGAEFTVHLPRHSAKAAAAGPAVAQASASRGRETILIVEDEPAVLRLSAQLLERLGYTALLASTPVEAIRVAREHGGEIHLLMTDVIMPEMNGRDLAKNLLTLYPNMRRLFMSGYTADVISHHGVLDEGVHFLQKPFSKDVLAAKLRAVLDGD